jgi:hypothetical protein
MLTLLTQSARTGNQLYGPPSPNAGSTEFARAGTGLQGHRHGRSPCSGWAPANAPEEKAKWDAPSGRQRLALWRAIWIRSLHASWSCWRAAISRGGLPGGQCHTAPPILERRKGQSRSVHVGRRHTSRLKPRTSSGRVIDSSLFHLLVGTRISVEKPLKNSTNAYYFQQISIGASL